MIDVFSVRKVLGLLDKKSKIFFKIYGILTLKWINGYEMLLLEKSRLMLMMDNLKTCTTVEQFRTLM